MALAYPSGSNTFTNDQRPVFTVNYWDTTYTPPSAGVEFTLFDLLDGGTFEQSMGTTPKSVARSILEDTGTGLLFNSSVVKPVLGYASATEYNTGVTAMIYDYWGAGTLPGGTQAKKLVLKYRGDVKVSGDVTLVFGGSGRVQVYNNGVEVGYGEAKEPTTDPDITTFSDFKLEGGYVAIPLTVAAGDDLEVYYWHNGEPWGGIFGKVLPYKLSDTYNPTTIRAELRDAPVMGASFFGVEAGGGDLASTPLPYVEEISLTRDVDKAPEAIVKVGLTTSDQPNGFSWNETNRTLVDNATGAVFKEDRRVEIVTGYGTSADLKNASGIVAAAETYSRLTGHITQFSLSDGLESVEIHVSGFENKLLLNTDQNYPDRLSYHANGYIYREGSSEPVWGITAFDNWPVEAALAEYLYRAGVDSLYLGKSYTDTDPDFGRKSSYTETAQELRYTRKLFGVRYLGDSTKVVSLERNTAYGNVGLLRKDYLPPDDEYLRVPEVTRRLYDQVTDIASHYGYFFEFDPLGRAVLRPGNNPDAFIFADTPGTITDNLTYSSSNISVPADRQLSPNALGGRHIEKLTSDAAWSMVVEGYFSRLDLYAGIGDDGTYNGAVFDYDVEVHNGSSWVSAGVSGSVSTYYDGEESHYYDGVLRTDGTNATVFELVSMAFDHYRVTITPGGKDAADVGAAAVYRVAGIAAFYQDPLSNYYPVSLATDTNVLKLSPNSTHQDLRNQVIVVGARKGVVTDSAKLSEVTNPSNPDLEFHVAVAADPASMYSPSASNFVGHRRVGVIYDNKISDTDFARWVALTTLFRYRRPSYDVPLSTPAIPQLELGDALLAHEVRHETVNQVVWVTGFKESWKSAEATVDITTTGYPEVPSYQPREEVPIDDPTLGYDPDGDGRGEPVVNLQISYRNLMGTLLTNTDVSAPDILSYATNSEAMGASPQALSSPVMPESLVLHGVSLVPGTGVAENRILTNTPYNHFWHISSWDGSHHPTVTWDVQEGDGDADVYSAAYYDMPSSGNYSWWASYRYFAVRTGNNPFYDPYSSELGHLVNVKFDALVSGRYRVSLWDARSDANVATPVAWLTNPNASGLSPEAHWVYLEPGTEVEFTWDGVDNIGKWNRLQSRDYAQQMAGAFGEEPLAVGEGFYAWNDQSTPMVQIGDAVAANYRTTGDVREIGHPFFTVGRYGQFYVRVEVLNDELARTDRDNGYYLPRIVESTDLPATLHDTTEAYVWTHLGEPNQVEVTVSDWDTTTYDWVENTVQDEWFTLTTEEATIRNGKPIRVNFTPRPRPGVLFEEDAAHTSVRTTRMVHLRATVFDQFWTFYNKVWDGVDARNDNVTEKRLTSRMFHNDDHTKQWVDDGFRTGEEISNLQWIFQPEFFEADFGKGYEEPLEYGDYEQLEALPGYNARQSGGVVRDDEAYITLAFMNYLFYVSAHTLDRSGRRQWCLNRQFIDKSKIVTPTWLGASYATKPEYAVDQEPHGADKYLKRSIFVREWRDPHWVSGDTRTPLSPRSASHPGTGGITDASELNWLQFPITDLDPLNNTSLDMPASAGFIDKWLEAYESDSSTVNDAVRLQDDLPGEAKTFPAVSDYLLPLGFGSWDFIRGSQSGLWFDPSPRRDFHPYWNSLMPNWHTVTTNVFTDADTSLNQSEGEWHEVQGADVPFTNAQHILAVPSSHSVHKLRDEKAQENWFGFAWNKQTGNQGAVLEQSVRGWAADEKRSTLANVFDYVRQDSLARFDQFRGAMGRGVYQNRDHKTTAHFWDREESRYAPLQAVRPAGTYLLNTARYDEYIISFPHDKNRSDPFQHFVTDVTDWYYIRFQHEYVWYNDRHFPVDGTGAARYQFFREEYTGVRRLEPAPFGSGPLRRARTYYDGGAWTGWKDDISSALWTANPRLRWRENSYNIFQAGVTQTGYHSGVSGYQGANSGVVPGQAWSYGGEAAGTTPAQLYWMGKKRYYQKRNLFDEGLGNSGYLRLAVGPELDTSREIYMNLVLPTNLKDAG